MGGGGEVLGQVGAPKAALMKRAALACARLARASSSTVSESVALCMRRASSAKRSSAASHTSIVVPLTAGTILEPTSTRLDVLSRAWAMRPCNTARKPLCSRVEVSWMSAHSTGAGEGEGGIDGGCGILGGAGGRGFGGGGLGKGGGDEGGGGPSGGKLSVGGDCEGGGGGGGG